MAWVLLGVSKDTHARLFPLKGAYWLAAEFDMNLILAIVCLGNSCYADDILMLCAIDCRKGVFPGVV